MTVLQDYAQFGGRHWETGSVHNYYAYRGVRAPHTGKPYSEAFFLGVSGGIAMGYFTFSYQGYDPQCNILTRNTFDPLDTLLSRLGVVQHVEQTALPQRAESILLDTLADGPPAMVWADMWSLPYTGLVRDEAMWGAMPILVFGVDRANGQVLIADRAHVPLTVSIAELAAARGRIKKDKHRLLTLEAPDTDKLAMAVRQGIQACINLFTEKPPKGQVTNFGLAAYRFWAEMLTNPKGRTSWAKVFPPGLDMYAGLTSAFSLGFLFGKGQARDGERGLYAEFLEEAAVVLDKPALREAAAGFRASGEAWQGLGQALLPDRIEPFGQARRLMEQRHQAFLELGNAGLTQRREMDAQLAGLRTAVAKEFLLTEGEAGALREEIAAQVLRVHDLEAQALVALRGALV